jgi:hypothetical protein
MKTLLTLIMATLLLTGCGSAEHKAQEIGHNPEIKKGIIVEALIPGNEIVQLRMKVGQSTLEIESDEEYIYIHQFFYKSSSKVNVVHQNKIVFGDNEINHYDDFFCSKNDAIYNCGIVNMPATYFTAWPGDIINYGVSIENNDSKMEYLIIRLPDENNEFKVQKTSSFSKVTELGSIDMNIYNDGSLKVNTVLNDSIGYTTIGGYTTSGALEVKGTVFGGRYTFKIDGIEPIVLNSGDSISVKFLDKVTTDFQEIVMFLE